MKRRIHFNGGPLDGKRITRSDLPAHPVAVTIDGATYTIGNYVNRAEVEAFYYEDETAKPTPIADAPRTPRAGPDRRAHRRGYGERRGRRP